MLLWGQIADATQCSTAQHPRIPMLIAIAAYLNSVTRSEPNGSWQPLGLWARFESGFHV